MPYKSREEQNKYTASYHKKAYAQLNIRLSKANEADIIDHIETIENKRQYIIELIRKDMEEK